MRYLKAQKNIHLPPSREIGDGLCTILRPDVEMLKILGSSDTPALRCPGSGCELFELFDKCVKPIDLEIGFGMGRFLVAKANATPEVHFLGIELEAARLARTDVAARTLDLKNISLIRAQANSMLMYCIPDARISNIYLLFPDPWPKARHSKNRIFQLPFVNSVHRILTSDGCLHVATDDEEYFNHMREVMDSEQRFFEAEPLKRSEEELTDFELKFAAKNKQVYTAAWQKN